MLRWKEQWLQFFPPMALTSPPFHGRQVNGAAPLSPPQWIKLYLRASGPHLSFFFLFPITQEKDWPFASFPGFPLLLYLISLPSRQERASSLRFLICLVILQGHRSGLGVPLAPPFFFPSRKKLELTPSPRAIDENDRCPFPWNSAPRASPSPSYQEYDIEIIFQAGPQELS